MAYNRDATNVNVPGPGKHQVRTRKGKTIYMTTNQVKGLGALMLAPGEAFRVLGYEPPPPARKGKGKKSKKSGFPHSTSSRSRPFIEGDFDPIRANPRSRYNSGRRGGVIRYNPFHAGDYDTGVAAPYKHPARLSGYSAPAHGVFSVRPEVQSVKGKKQTIYRIYHHGQPTEYYALSEAKAFEITQRLDPNTGKKTQMKWAPGSRASRSSDSGTFHMKNNPLSLMNTWKGRRRY